MGIKDSVSNLFSIFRKEYKKEYEKETGSKSEPEVVKFSKIPLWIREREDGTIKNKAKDIESELKTISEYVDECRSMILKISKSEPPKETHPKVKKILSTQFPHFMKIATEGFDKIDEEIDNLKFAGDIDADDVRNFHKILIEILAKIGNADVAHGRYLPYAYGEEISQYRSYFKKLVKASHNLGDMVVREGDMVKIENIASDIKSKISHLSGINKEIEQVEDEKRRMESDAESASRELEDFERSKEALKFKNSSARLKECTGEIKKADAEIYDFAGSLSRVFKKFYKLMEDAEKKSMVEDYMRDNRMDYDINKISKILRDYIDSPVETFISDNDDVIDVILDLAGNFKDIEDLKDSDLKKIAAGKNNINDAKKTRISLKSLYPEKEELENIVNSSEVPVIYDKLNFSIAKINKDVIKISKRLGEHKGKKKKTQARIEGLKKDINGIMEKFNASLDFD